MCSSIYMVKLNFECNKDIFAYVLQGISYGNSPKVTLEVMELKKTYLILN